MMTITNTFNLTNTFNPKLLKITLVSCFCFFVKVHAQTITGVSASGAVVVKSGSQYSITWTAAAGASSTPKSLIISFSNSSGNSQVFFSDTSSNTNWELQYGSGQSNAWKEFCPSANSMPWKPGNGSGTETVNIRNTSTTLGSYSNLITFGFGNNCNQFTSSITISATVNIVDPNTGIYTWSEPTGGSTDSSYNIAGNWTPTRSIKKSTDILVVDLADSTKRNTTIYMDGVSDSISQFIIYPNNHVTFKCSTSSNSGNWYIGENGKTTTGDEFRLDSTGGIRYAGGTLNLQVLGNHQAVLNDNVSMVSGTLNLKGPGTFNFRKDLNLIGGTLNFQSSVATTLSFTGSNTKLTGTGGTLYIDSTVDVVIGNGSTSNYTLERTLPIISSLRLANNTTLISNTSSSYTTPSDITNYNPYLILKATAKPNSDAHGQLYTVPSSSSITGGASFEIYNNVQRSYRAFGLPLIDGTVLPQFTDDIELTGTVVAGSTNANEFTTSCSYCTHSIFSWNESTGAWAPYNSGNSVTNVPLGSGVLTFFRGARNNGLGDPNAVANEQVIDFKGRLQTGNVSVTLNNAGSGALKGYNLVGNPYPCAIDLRQVYESNKTKILPRFYFYDAIAKSYNTWDSTNTGGPKSPSKSGTSRFTNPGNSKNFSQILDAGGAVFMVVDNASSTVSIDFTEAMKTNGLRSATKHFHSGVQEEGNTFPCNELKAQLRRTHDSFPESDGVTIEFDREEYVPEADKYDVPKFHAGFVGLGTLAGSSWLSIDRRNKIAEIGQTQTIPLKVAYPKDGPTELELSFEYCEAGNGNYEVKLFDKVTNTFTEVGHGSSYIYNAASTDEKRNDRFDLVFTGVEAKNNVNKEKISGITVYPNPTENEITFVSNTHNHPIQSVELINSLGQTIKNIQVKQNAHTIEINHGKLNPGIYFVRIRTDKQQGTLPLMVK